MQTEQLKETLEFYYDKYNRIDFIENDPISIPHLFSKNEDIEISGFITATLAWGQRITIINNATKLMQLMDNAPHEFILNSTKRDLLKFKTFVHRTFNGEDCVNFILSLKNIYTHHQSIGTVFENYLNKNPEDFAGAIHHFRTIFSEKFITTRTKKHIADPLSNSSAKRICMYMRWMVRKDNRGVDFGIWNISSSILHCPLDLHSGRIARSLNLLYRKQDDWKAVEELTASLRLFDKNDPAKYDFALFGMGVNKVI